MKTLENMCCDSIIRWMFDLLLMKKKSIASEKWIINLEEWITLMKLDEIRDYFQIVSKHFDFLRHNSLDFFQNQSRYHDILVCFYSLFVSDSTVKLIVPKCLQMDQLHRSFLIKLLNKYEKLKMLSFECYSGYSTYYVSDEEQSLLQKVFQNLKLLTLVKLPNVATNEILQEMMNSCPNISVLELAPNQKVDDSSAEIISGRKTLVVKGPLKVLKNVKEPKVNAKLKLLDISGTCITFSGRTLLSTFLSNCTIICRNTYQSL